MGQTVYADILFLINFSMDFLCFYITSSILRRRLPKIRAVLASAAGGVYSVGILFAGFVPPLELVCDIAAGLLMCMTVYAGKKTSFPKFLLCSAVYVGVSAALGGLMTALFNLINTLGLPLGSLESAGDGIPVWLFALLAAFSGIATLAGGRFFRIKQSEKTADIEITYCGKTVRMTAITDSGNLLRDPVSGRLVVVADLNRASSVLPETVIRAVRRNDASLLSSLPSESAKTLRLVPARTATGGNMLFAFLPERITVSSSDGKPHEVDALFAPAVLKSETKGFDALLPPELLV